MSLIAWYPLNGNLEDYSENKQSLQNNGATINNAGKIGKSYSFSNNYMTVPKNCVISNTFSISVWVYITSSQNSCIYNTRTVSGEGLSLFILTDGIRFDAGGQWSTGYNPPLNTWVHLTFIKSNNIKKLFVNGQFYKEASCVELSKLNTKAYIACSMVGDSNPGNYLIGKLNDIRIYDHELSIKEVKEIYKTKILHYKFNNPYEEATVNLQNKFSFSTAEKGTDYFVKKETDQWHQGAILTTTNVEAGKTYTWGIDIKSDTSFTIKFDANCTASNYTGNDAAMSSVKYDSVKYDTIGKWKRIYLTVTVKSDAEKPCLHHSFCPAAITGVNLKIYVRNGQLEEKKTDTPFVDSKRTGGIKDCSGFRNHGICDIYPSWSDESSFSTGCFEFNGTQSIKTSGSVLPTSSPQEWTVSCWVKFSSSPTGYQYLTNTNQGVRLHHSSTRALNYINGGTNDWYKYSKTIPNPTEWFHFASTFNQQTDTIKIWINGVNHTDTSGPNNSGGTKQPAGVQSILELFKGFIGCASDFRLYATELSDTDIKEIYETKASVSKNAKLFVSEIIENKNYAEEMNLSINKKEFSNGLAYYTQSHCQVTITEDGYRIYRTPNLIRSTAGNVMWGGMRLCFPEGTFQKGRKYKFSALVKGKTSKAIGDPYLTPQMGWTAGGLTALYASSAKNIPANFDSDSYQYFEAIFDLTNFNTYQTATKTESIFTQGQVYNCCRDLAWGFGYEDTGELGTDLYINELSLTDITDNKSVMVNKKGQLETKEIIEYNFKPTLIDYSQWTLATGSVGDWSQNGTTAENKRILKINPKGNLDIVWATESNDSDNNSDGGWNVSGKSIDKTKKYRFTCWIKRENAGNGRTYFGCQANTVCNLGTTTVNNNPYFYNGLIDNVPEVGETWCLFVAYIHPHDYTGSGDPTNGFYRGDTKVRTRGCTDFKWEPNATSGGVRSYLYYSTSTSERQYWYRPRFEICDGSEPSIQTLLNCCEHLPLVNNKGVIITKNIFSINKDGSCISTEFVES